MQYPVQVRDRWPAATRAPRPQTRSRTRPLSSPLAACEAGAAPGPQTRAPAWVEPPTAPTAEQILTRLGLRAGR
ncbi:hypothetical protein NDU88_002707 [Pleurodeles waltl]|uniref:Uncharacterized protein n=1 Tax=Pleurodeles waltl TaxID=8319 RepID=A0AAV7UCA4_PLEWA|nr:hypothetical protein NDU88_002707 [Pleurodeles waltl]